MYLSSHHCPNFAINITVVTTRKCIIWCFNFKSLNFTRKHKQWKKSLVSYKQTTTLKKVFERQVLKADAKLTEEQSKRPQQAHSSIVAIWRDLFIMPTGKYSMSLQFFVGAKKYFVNGHTYTITMRFGLDDRRRH